MIKVAFASKDGVHVNEHFGWCERFYIYEINGDYFSLIKEVESLKEYEDEAQKLESKIEALDDSDIVYVNKIGPKASNMVKISGTFPIRASSEDEKIEDVALSLQKLMREDPPLWLKRILLK